MRRINNVRELRKSLKRGNSKFRLCLNGGIFSRKSILLSEDGSFSVLNGIDGSTQKLTSRQIYTESNIGNAMRRGAFVEESG